jgi:hypothetical protein
MGGVTLSSWAARMAPWRRPPWRRPPPSSSFYESLSGVDGLYTFPPSLCNQSVRVIRILVNSHVDLCLLSSTRVPKLSSAPGGGVGGVGGDGVVRDCVVATWRRGDVATWRRGDDTHANVRHAACVTHSSLALRWRGQPRVRGYRHSSEYPWRRQYGAPASPLQRRACNSVCCTSTPCATIHPCVHAVRVQ